LRCFAKVSKDARNLVLKVFAFVALTLIYCLGQLKTQLQGVLIALRVNKDIIMILK
jgi:hypothetical protein